MQAADAFNVIGQGIGSIQEQIMQGIGAGVLAAGIPAKSGQIRKYAEDFGNTEQSIWNPVVSNIKNTRDSIAGAFGNDYWTKGKDAAVKGYQDANKAAGDTWADARAHVEEVRNNNAAAKAAFEGDRAAALKDLSQQQVYSMESINASNSKAVDEAVRKRAEQLFSQGFEPDDIQVSQANTALKAEYGQFLADQQKQINMGYADQRRQLHTDFANVRTNLEAVTSQALETANATATEAGMNYSRVQLDSATGTIDAYTKAAEGAVTVGKALNDMDAMSGGILQGIETRRQDLYLKAEEIELMGLTAIAGAFLNWNISVPQMRPKSDTGGGGGGGPSFTGGLDLGPFSVGAST